MKYWSYAHSEINKRWALFNNLLDSEDMINFRFGRKSVPENVDQDVMIAFKENRECDNDLRQHFLF